MNNLHNTLSFHLPPPIITTTKKTRTKFPRITLPTTPKQRKPARKPDPTAPKITEPCTECGKRFWSWKALFGHMRCHPERPWRGINPPTNFPPPPEASAVMVMEEEDYEVAACLLILANQEQSSDLGSGQKNPHEEEEWCEERHKCSVCFRVFSSGQALGGHKRCHRDKIEIEIEEINGSPSKLLSPCPVDLNLPFAPLYQHPLDLRLRLGL